MFFSNSLLRIQDPFKNFHVVGFSVFLNLPFCLSIIIFFHFASGLNHIPQDQAMCIKAHMLCVLLWIGAGTDRAGA